MTFFAESIYLIGPIRKQKHYTPYISTIFSELGELETPFFYPTLNNKIFYNNLIFNTYILNKEENFCTLYSADNKLTIIKNTDIKENTLFTVKISQENEFVRIAEIYKFDCDKSVGYVCYGTVVRKEIKTDKKNSKKNKENAKNGKKKNVGTKNMDDNVIVDIPASKNKYKYTVLICNKEYEFVAIRDYENNEKIKVMLVRKDINKEEKMIYREVDYFTNDNNNKFFVQIEREDKNSYYCKGVYIKGLINKAGLNREIKIGEILQVKVLQENNFKFVFGLENSKNMAQIETKRDDTTFVMNKMIYYDVENKFDIENKMICSNAEFNLKPGMIKEAIVKNYHRTHGTFVLVDGFTGIMKKCETSKDYVNDIERYLIGKKTVKGMIYNVNEKEKKFMFSVKKYETRMSENIDDHEMSVPFKKQKNEIQSLTDRKNHSDDSVEKHKIDDNIFSEIQSDKSNFVNIECKNNDIRFFNSTYNTFYVENVQNTLEKLINYEQKLEYIEKEIQNSNKNDNYEFFCILLAKLIILQEENIYEIVKKYYRTTTEVFFREIIETLENQNLYTDKYNENVYKLYYKTYKNEFAYQKLIKYNMINRIEDDNVYKNEHKHLAIPIFYDIVPNEARVRTEKIIQKDYKCWKAYIEIEVKQQTENTIEYIRNLYRRAVKSDFSVNETKEMFKKWLEFEKKTEGDCEEVKNKAKEYVENINKK